MDNTQFLKTYDYMLYSVGEGIETLADQVAHTAANRPSVLNSYAFIGMFTARIYTATAMAQQYLKLRLWEEDPSRLQEDEQNLGMLFYYYNQDKLQSRLDEIWSAIATPRPEEHYYEELAAVENKIASALQIVNNGRFIDKIPPILTNLLVNVLNIYAAQHPDTDLSTLNIKVRTPKIDYFPKVITDPLRLMLQQAYAIADFSHLFHDVLHGYASWPLAAAQVLIFVCDMEHTISTARKTNVLSLMSNEDFFEAAEQLRNDGLDSFSDEIELLCRECAILINTMDRKLGKAIEDSIFPLYTLDKPPVDLCWPYVALLDDILPLYNTMAYDYYKIVERPE